ncbi:hypothetical protein [Luteimicrobium album]|nr:hypothetical protein [Luteimicrobium album]
MTAARHAQRGVAALRAVLGLGLSLFLLVNFPARNYLWGPASRWTDPLNTHMGFGGVFRLFAPTHSLGVLTIWYVLLLLAAVALMLGWHARAVTPVVLVLSTGLLSSQPFGWDQGDNVLRLLLFYLAFADAGVAGRWIPLAATAPQRKRLRTRLLPPGAGPRRPSDAASGTPRPSFTTQQWWRSAPRCASST